MMEPESTAEWTPQDWLEHALEVYRLPVTQKRVGLVQLTQDYAIEVEANGVFRLSQAGQVIAPFVDLDELCQFIKMGLG